MKNIMFWERLLEDAPQSYKEWFEEEKKYLAEHITKDAKVLEVGCGEGRSLNDVIDITENLIGVDHDEKAVADAKNNFKNYPEVKILLADGKELPFGDNTFDFVICMTSFVNFGGDKIKILNEMKRVIKEDGAIIISVFSEDAFEERMNVYKRMKAPIKEIKETTVIFDEKFGDNISEQFSKEQLTELFNKVNLEIEDIKKVGIAYLCKLRK